MKRIKSAQEIKLAAERAKVADMPKGPIKRALQRSLSLQTTAMQLQRDYETLRSDDVNTKEAVGRRLTNELRRDVTRVR